MAFEERIIPALSRLSHKLIDAHAFHYLENVANFLSSLHSGQWRRMPVDEQMYWIKQMSSLLGPRGLGDSWDLNDADLNACLEILDGQEAALRRLL